MNVQVTTCPPQCFGVFWLCICWVWQGKPRNSISFRSVAAPLGTRLGLSKSSLDRQLKVMNLLLWLERSWQWANFQKCWTIPLNIVFFCSGKKGLVKEVKQYITLDCFLWAPSTLSCTVVCVLYVCICEHTRAHFSAFQWDFHKLPQSWAPGSAGWRALLKALLKLVYFCAAERLCNNGFPNDCHVWQLNSEGLFLYLSLLWRFLALNRDNNCIELQHCYLIKIQLSEEEIQDFGDTVSKDLGGGLRWNVSKGKGYTNVEIPYW